MVLLDEAMLMILTAKVKHHEALEDVFVFQGDRFVAEGLQEDLVGFFIRIALRREMEDVEGVVGRDAAMLFEEEDALIEGVQHILKDLDFLAGDFA